MGFTVHPRYARVGWVFVSVAIGVSGMVLAAPEEPETPPAHTAGPYTPHSGGSGAGTGLAGVTVRLREIQPEKGPLGQGPTSAHIQGQFEQDILGTADDAASSSAPPAGTVDSPQQPLDQSAPAGSGGIVTEFEGQSDTGWIPPDTIMAVGPEHVVEAVNVGFTIYSKLGRTVQGYTTFQNLFSPVVPSGWNGFMFDPKVVYLPSFHNTTSEGRWLMFAIGRDNSNQTSHFFIAVSQGEDPTDWWLYRHDNTFANSADSDAWLDYCGLSGDNWGLYVTCNMFLWTNNNFKHAKIHSLNPAMYTGGASNGWSFWGIEWPGGSKAFTVQPALPHSIAGGDETFFVNSFSGSGSDVLLWTLTGDRTNMPTLNRAQVDVDDYDAIGQNVDQPDSSTDLDGGDSRILHAAYNQRHVFTTMTDDVNADGSASGAYTMKLDVDDGTNDWDHLLWAGSGKYVFYPAITFDGSFSSNDNIGVFASYATDTDYVSGVYKIYENQPTDGSGPFVLFEAGDAAYVDLDGNNRNRWGDYTGAHYDWTCGNLWGAVEIAGTGNSWRTRVAARTFDTEPPCALLDLTSPGDGDVVDALTTTTITWNSAHIPSGDTIALDYSTDGGDSATVITSGLASSTTSYNWLVPDAPTSQARVRVRTSSGATDWSDNVFTIGACPDDSFEPDDVCFGPTQTVGTTETHLQCDEDWVTFSPTLGTTYQIETSGLVGGSDTVLELYDNCVGPIAIDDDGGSGVASRIEWTANIVFPDIRVRQFANDYRAGEGYDITIDVCDSSCELMFASGFE